MVNTRSLQNRLSVHRSEEHTDNSNDYANNGDVRQYDLRLRGPVDPRELQVDPRAGIKFISQMTTRDTLQAQSVSDNHSSKLSNWVEAENTIKQTGIRQAQQGSRLYARVI